MATLIEFKTDFIRTFAPCRQKAEEGDPSWLARGTATFQADWLPLISFSSLTSEGLQALLEQLKVLLHQTYQPYCLIKWGG